MNTLKKLHRDEEGLEALQVVMILAIAAVILGALKFFWPTIKTWFTTNTQNVVDFEKGAP